MEIKTIGIILLGFSNGGIERVATYLIPLFQKMGFRVVALTDKPASDKEYNLNFKVDRVVIGSPGDSARITRISEAIKQFHIDLVIDNEYYIGAKALMLDLQVVKNAGAKFIIHQHSVFTRYLLSDRQESEFLSILSTYGNADAIIVLSRVDAAFYSVCGCKAFYIQNPVPVVPLCERKLNNGHPNLLWIGRFSEVKRPTHAIRVFSGVLRKFPLATLTMLGDYTHEGLREYNKVVKVMRELGVRKNAVKFLGFKKDVPKYLAQADVFISTSRYEGFSAVIGEAMAAGIPIVSYDMPYIEFLRLNDNIMIVPQEDVVTAVNCVIALLESPARNAEVGSSNRVAYERFSTYDLAGAYSNLFQNVERGSLRGGADYNLEDVSLALKTLMGHIGIALDNIQGSGYFFRKIRRLALTKILSWRNKMLFSKG